MAGDPCRRPVGRRGSTVLGRGWDRAEATIVARNTTYSGIGSVVTHVFVTDVRLASGEVFRATVEEPRIAVDFWPPDTHDTVSVLVRPRDRKVTFDKDDARLSRKAVVANRHEQLATAQHQPAGTPTPAWTVPAGLPGLMGQKLARLGIVPGSPLPALGADAPQAQALLAAFAGASSTLAASAGASTAVVATPEARLARLDALRERGLVSAEEHAAARRRILAEL